MTIQNPAAPLHPDAVDGLVERSERLLQAVLGRAPIGFALVDHDLRFELLYDAMAELHGVSVVEAIGRSIPEVLPDLATSMAALIHGVFESGNSVVGLEVSGETPAPPGEHRSWLASYYRIDLGGGDSRVGVFMDDNSARARSRINAERLADLTSKLSHSLTAADIGSVISSEGAEYLGAEFLIAGLYDSGGEAIEILGNGSVDSFVPKRLDARGNATTYGEAIRANRKILATSAADRRQRFCDDPLNETVIEASGAVPCHAADGSIAGVLVAGWGKAMRRADMAGPQLRTLGSLVGQALERARISDERGAVLDRLQEGAVHDIDELPDGIQVAVRYEPASDAIGFGGDWYDVIVLDADRIAFIVGDVVGHDSAAAADMTRIKATLSAIVRLETNLASVIDTTEALLRKAGSNSMASVAVAILDRRANTVSMVSAGHPAQLVVNPTGRCERLAAGLRPWIGAGQSDDARVELGVTHLEAGSTLVLFTDGLVERRGSDIDSDVQRLVDHMEAVHDHEVDQIADGLLLDFWGDRSDDTALIVARLEP